MERSKLSNRLVELLVIGAIVAVLAALAFPYLSAHRIEGFNDRAVSDLRNLVLAQEAYFEANKVYASSLGDLAGFAKSSEVTLRLASATPKSFIARAEHARGDQVYSWDSSLKRFEPPLPR
jgi:Tfp pilus assembly protein PilE